MFHSSHCVVGHPPTLTPWQGRPTTAKINPLLDVIPENQPVYKSSWHGYNDILVFVVNEVIEGAVATNVTTKFAGVITRNDSLIYFEKDVLKDSQKSNVVYYDKGIALGYNIDRNSLSFKNNIPAFACLKINYTNKAGIGQKPMVMVFKITNEYDKKFPPVYGTEYDRIISFLKSKKIF